MKWLCIQLGAILLAGSLSAAVPKTLVYQGRLTNYNDESVPSGFYLIQFRIYDAPSAGTVLWDNGYRTVLVANGIFSYNLGDSTALPANLFEDTARWLGIKVGAEMEMIPRVKLGSVAYALHALKADSAGAIAGDPFVDETGDTMRGDLVVENPVDGEVLVYLNISTSGRNAILSLFDSDASPSWAMARLSSDRYGELLLRDTAVADRVNLNAGDGHGGMLSLYAPSQGLKFQFDAGETDDAAALLPSNVINEDEILNEPGIGTVYTFQADLTSATDVVVDSLEVTAPTDGYLLVLGSGIFYRIHTQGGGDAALRASVGATRSIDLDNGAIWTVESTQPSETYYCPFSVSCVLPVVAGTEEVFLVADAHVGSGVVVRAHLTAMYLPTAYATVEATKGTGRSSMSVDGSDLPLSEEYDARAVIEAERKAQLEAQRQEMEAKAREAEREESRE